MDAKAVVPALYGRSSVELCLFFLFGSAVAAWWLATEIGPPLPASSRDDLVDLQQVNEHIHGIAVYYENLTAQSFLAWLSFVLVYEIAGFLLLASCVLLKWSLLCPYHGWGSNGTIHLERLFSQDILTQLVASTVWSPIKQEFSYCCNLAVEPFLLVHRVRVGKESLIFSCNFGTKPQAVSQDSAENVSHWLSSARKLRNPWASILSPSDVTVGGNCECVAGSLIESGVTLKDGSATATLDCVTKNVEPKTTVVGGPADLIFSQGQEEPINNYRPS
jgi:hypothetical protein